MGSGQKRVVSSCCTMGNIIGNVQKKSKCQNSNPRCEMEEFTSVNEFSFMEPFDDSTTNGLYFNHIFLPEEVIIDILSYIPPDKLLGLTLVCKKWCNIIKSENFWMNVYNRRFPSKAKKLPWYIFYCYFTTDNFQNLLKNGNGQEQFKYWKIIRNGGDGFQIEKSPHGSDPLPQSVPDFQGFTSCFATSFRECTKIQEICLDNKRLLQYILNTFKPTIYASEWVAGRFDCGCTYRLTINGYNTDYAKQMALLKNRDNDPHYDIEDIEPLFSLTNVTSVTQWEGKEWEKVEVTVPSCPPNIHTIVFEHSGRDTQFWKGHYGSKMAGGVLRILFDSIEPLEEDMKETIDDD